MIIKVCGMRNGENIREVEGLGVDLMGFIFDTKSPSNSNKKNILSIYFCAGYPCLDNTVEVIKTLEQNGVSMIEIGIPFSDPMADGVVIQNAATQALKNGMSLKLLFSQLKDVRKEVQIPLVLMGYLNPILQYGFENFCKECSACGIDGMIIPDLPFVEYMSGYKSIADSYGVHIIMLITSETSEDRIRMIDQNTDGFIYMVSSAATTGAQQNFEGEKQKYFEKIQNLQLNNPRMIGFGISNKQTFDTSCKYASGAIVGSKLVSLQAETKDSAEAIALLKIALQN